jgi:hypothetical protein
VCLLSQYEVCGLESLSYGWMSIHSRPRARMFSPLEHGSGHRAIAVVVQIDTPLRDEPSLPVQERRVGTRHKTDPSPSW